MYNTQLRWFLDGGVSPYHTVEQTAKYLSECGFSALELGERFDIQKGGKYFVASGTFLAAFTVGSEANYFRIAASHTDWPCLRIKPVSEQIAGGCCKLSVESYGGGIFSTWMDRPLSLAGVVMVKGENAMKPVSKLISWDEPLLTIPNLAIHMNREVNKGVPIRANVDMLPICRTVEDGFGKDGYLLKKMSEKLGVDEADILSFELYVYCAEKAQLIGFENDFLSAPRLDNLTSVHATIDGLVKANGKGINMAILL